MPQSPLQASRYRGCDAPNTAERAPRARSPPCSARRRAWGCGGTPAGARGAWLPPARKTCTTRPGCECLGCRGHPHLLGCGIVLLHQPPHSQGEIHRRTSLGNVQMPPSALGLEERKDVEHTLALVLVLVALRKSRLLGQGLTFLGHHLVG